MSYFVGGAIVVSAIAGAVSSNKASKDQSKGVQKGLDQSLSISQQARQDVMSLFERSANNSGMGMKAALDYYKTAAPKRYQPYIQGSNQAQQVIGQGAVQANNAILGLPVDMGFVNQPQIVPGTDHMIGAEIPEFETGSIYPQEIGAGGASPQQSDSSGSGKPSTKDSLLTGGGVMIDPTKKEFYDPVERLTNPLGLSKSLNDKISPKKLLKKIF
jgi:hypothetical protein